MNPALTVFLLIYFFLALCFTAAYLQGIRPSQVTPRVLLITGLLLTVWPAVVALAMVQAAAREGGHD